MHKEWGITAEAMEKELKRVQVGQSVLVQNKAGNRGKRWARTGTVVET